MSQPKSSKQEPQPDLIQTGKLNHIVGEEAITENGRFVSNGNEYIINSNPLSIVRMQLLDDFLIESQVSYSPEEMHKQLNQLIGYQNHPGGAKQHDVSIGLDNLVRSMEQVVSRSYPIMKAATLLIVRPGEDTSKYDPIVDGTDKIEDWKTDIYAEDFFLLVSVSSPAYLNFLRSAIQNISETLKKSEPSTKATGTNA